MSGGSWFDSKLDQLRTQAASAFQRLEHSVVPPEAPVVGVLGDDLAAGYIGAYPARNWVEILGATGRLNFGPFSRGAPGAARGPGFALNWAKLGATSGEAMASQLPGIVQQVATGNVDYVVVSLGSNDYGRFLATEALGLANRPGDFLKRLQEVEKAAIDNLDDIQDDLLDANAQVRLVVTTIPDLTRTPAVEQGWKAAKGNPRVLEAVRRSIGRFNQSVRASQFAAPRIAVADLANQLDPRLRGTGMLSIGEAQVDLASYGNDYHQFLLADGMHPGTVAQGLMGNAVVSALREKFKVPMEPIGPVEILGLAQAAIGSFSLPGK